MDILHFIASDGFITVNKNLIKDLGLHEAILIGELASEHNYWMSRFDDFDGWFYSTIENIEEKTTLSKYQQKKAFDKLKASGIIKLQVCGIPARRFIQLDGENLANKLARNLQTVERETCKLDGEKLACNNNIINNNIINDNIDIECAANATPKLPIIYKDVIDYLNYKAGTNYQYSTKDTQRRIKARQREGFVLEDFKTVIDIKCDEWLSDAKMSQYIRPQTLFGANFESYLNQSIKMSVSGGTSFFEIAAEMENEYEANN